MELFGGHRFREGYQPLHLQPFDVGVVEPCQSRFFDELVGLLHAEQLFVIHRPVVGFAHAGLETPEDVQQLLVGERQPVFELDVRDQGQGDVDDEQMAFDVLPLPDEHRPRAHVGLHDPEAVLDDHPLAGDVQYLRYRLGLAPQFRSPQFGDVLPVVLARRVGDVGDVGVEPRQSQIPFVRVVQLQHAVGLDDLPGLPVHLDLLDVLLPVLAVVVVEPARPLEELPYVLEPFGYRLFREPLAVRIELHDQLLLVALAVLYPAGFVHGPLAAVGGHAVLGGAVVEKRRLLPAQGLYRLHVDVVPPAVVYALFVPEGVQPGVGDDNLGRRRLAAELQQGLDGGLLALAPFEGAAADGIPLLVQEQPVFDDRVRPVVLLDAVRSEPVVVLALDLEIEIGAVVVHGLAAPEGLRAGLRYPPHYPLLRLRYPVQGVVEVVRLGVHALDEEPGVPRIPQFAPGADHPQIGHEPRRVVYGIAESPFPVEFGLVEQRLQPQIGPSPVQDERGQVEFPPLRLHVGGVEDDGLGLRRRFAGFRFVLFFEGLDPAFQEGVRIPVPFGKLLPRWVFLDGPFQLFALDRIGLPYVYGEVPVLPGREFGDVQIEARHSDVLHIDAIISYVHESAYPFVSFLIDKYPADEK